MYGFILGFQRFVWCPKWTPASSNCLMVKFDIDPPGFIFRLSRFGLKTRKMCTFEPIERRAE
jgi:hypothetical protein